MFQFIKVNLTKGSTTVDSFVTYGDCHELIEELIHDFNTKQVRNKVAQEFLDDCQEDIGNYTSVCNFIKDILLYNGYLVDAEDEFDISIDEEQ